MSDAARRKEKQRLKRDKKKAAARRAASVSPYKHIGQSGELEACYINSNWEESGLAQLHVIRQNPVRGYTMASFLIDIWCCGLKDAFGRMGLMRDDIDDQLDLSRDHYELVRIDLETARNFVASAIRFSRQNGFRLPAHYDRWINILGGELNIENADLNGFGKDGKLFWTGPIDDLRKQLVSCSVDDFLARSDVEYISEEEGSDEYERDEEKFQELVEACRAAMKTTADIACERTGETILARSEAQGRLMLEATRLLTAYQLHKQAAKQLSEARGEFASDFAEAQLQAAEEFRDEIAARLDEMDISEAALDEMMRDINLRGESSDDRDLSGGLKAFVLG